MTVDPDVPVSLQRDRLAMNRWAAWLVPLRSFLRYWNGRWHLRSGYCPICNSSPPLLSCRVCIGSRKYGPDLDEDMRRVWRERLDRERHLL